jgi:hypothetical protein
MCRRLMFGLAAGCGGGVATSTSSEVVTDNAIPDPSGGGFRVLLGPDGLDGSTYYSGCKDYCDQVLMGGTVSCAGPAPVGPNGVTFADGTTFPTASISGTGDQAIRCDYQDVGNNGCGGSVGHLPGS